MAEWEFELRTAHEPCGEASSKCVDGRRRELGRAVPQPAPANHLQ